MRHVSRTHRVYIDWLFDRINHENAIHVQSVNTAQHIADVLSKGSYLARAFDAIDTLVWFNGTSNALFKPFFGICILSRSQHGETPSKIDTSAKISRRTTDLISNTQ